jgi:hypothetical protein
VEVKPRIACSGGGGRIQTCRTLRLPAGARQGMCRRDGSTRIVPGTCSGREKFVALGSRRDIAPFFLLEISSQAGAAAGWALGLRPAVCKPGRVARVEVNLQRIIDVERI